MVSSTMVSKKVQVVDKPVEQKVFFSDFVYDFATKKLRKIVLDPKIWKKEVKKHLVQQVVVSQQASWRLLNRKRVKDRSDVSGGGKKPWKQKGTGRARHGSIRSPLWRGGGVTFGPTGKENYAKKSNRKVFRQALTMILGSFYQSQNLLLWKDQDFAEIKTKQVFDLLVKFNLLEKKVLFIVEQGFPNLLLSARNLKNVKVIFVQNLNPYDLVNSDKLLLQSSVVPFIEKWLG